MKLLRIRDDAIKLGHANSYISHLDLSMFTQSACFTSGVTKESYTTHSSILKEEQQQQQRQLNRGEARSICCATTFRHPHSQLVDWIYTCCILLLTTN